MIAYLRLLVQNRTSVFRGGTAKDGKPQSKPVKVLKTVGIAVLALILYASIAMLEYLLFDTLNSIGQGQTVLGLALLGCTMITLIYGFFYINGLLFFSKDTGFLAAMPITSRSILSCKMIMAAAGEAGVSLLFAAPLVVCYGISEGLGILYYLKSLIVFATIPLLPLTVGMLLSFLLIRISGLWKRREGVTTLVSFALFALIMIGEFSLGSMEDSEITQWLVAMVVGQRSFAQLLLRNLPWLGWANDGIVAAGAAGLGHIALYLLLSIGVFVLAAFLLGGGYMKLAVKQEESISRVNNTKKRVFKGKDEERTPMHALVMREIKDVLSVPVYATNCLIGMAVMPIMVAMIIFTLSQEGNLGELTVLLDVVPKAAYIAVATAAFGFLGSMCEAASTAISREGAAHELRKTYPLSGGEQLRAKAYMGLVFHMIGVVLITVMLIIMLPSFWIETLVAAVCSVAPAALMSLSSVIIDAYHPRLNWKNETEAVKQNTNALLSMLLNMVAIAVLIGAFVLCFLCLKLDWIGSFVVTMVLAVALDALLLLWMNRGAAKAYYAH